MVKKPTDVLEEEHHVIQKVVAAMVVLLARLEEGKDVKGETINKVVEFMRTFGDKCHHGKEESHLFPLLGKRGVPMTGCPIAVLVHEHEKGRSLVKQLLEAGTAYVNGDGASKSALIKSLQGLIELYPNHIWKEEYLLFPMTNKVLSDEDQKELFEKFEMVEKEIGADVHEHFENIVEELVSEI
jgi:hemerythrin-like domain-containing protein